MVALAVQHGVPHTVRGDAHRVVVAHPLGGV